MVQTSRVYITANAGHVSKGATTPHCETCRAFDDPRSAWPLVGVISAMTAVTSTRGRKDRGEIFGDQDQSHTFTFSAPQEATEGAVGGGTTVAPIDDVRQEKRNGGTSGAVSGFISISDTTSTRRTCLTEFVRASLVLLHKPARINYFIQQSLGTASIN
ncbi:hypothetical protein BHE74_00048207 [Ensete ventricosum]|nr:hypothetical protein GW17_00042535 [Ensete ventricosum]RWW45910.1 hypothetical protein BHE74_00048207 [Ensete ventricosum]RZS26031.1 hypothetical protein BHM03_00059321 [Ensete ventricosum]